MTVYPENHVVLTPFVNVLTGNRPKQAARMSLGQKLTALFLLLYIATFLTTPVFANEIQDV